MGTVTSRLNLPYPTSAAEALWYDPQRWPSFLDGFGHLQKVEGDWPRVGARVVWDTPPGGRGRVSEVVERYEARACCVTRVEDERVHGTQTVTFAPQEGGTTMTLALAYTLKDAKLINPVLDLLFIRRAQRESLQRTLRRFALELRDDVAPPV